MLVGSVSLGLGFIAATFGDQPLRMLELRDGKVEEHLQVAVELLGHAELCVSIPSR